MDYTALEKEVSTATIEDAINNASETNTGLGLWTGEKSVKLTNVELFTTEKGVKYFRLFFMDSTGVPMPSQFADQMGNIAIRHDQFLNNFVPSMKFIHTMPSTATAMDVIKLLETEFHTFYFITKSSMKPWGMSMFTVIDYKLTSERVRGVQA